MDCLAQPERESSPSTAEARFVEYFARLRPPGSEEDTVAHEVFREMLGHVWDRMAEPDRDAFARLASAEEHEPFQAQLEEGLAWLRAHHGADLSLEGPPAAPASNATAASAPSRTSGPIVYAATLQHTATPATTSKRDEEEGV